MTDQNRRPPQAKGDFPPRRPHSSPPPHSRNHAPGNPRAGGKRWGYRRHRGRGITSLSGPQVVQKYLNLLEQHLNNRKKYFEYYDREQGRHRDKLESAFFESIEQLRRFEAKLEEWQWVFLKKNLVDRYKLDLTYSSNHSLNPVAERVDFQGHFEDPHFTENQKEAFSAYSQDQEESVGSYEEYLKYKQEKN
jgi:hypothetical protein